MSSKRKRQGFSLVELSIVLVIVGLLAGAVLAGKSLIHAAELRSVTSDYSLFVTATNSFKQQYQALPGDMPNATSFWGYAGAGVIGCVNNTGAATNANGVCDGNGDGYVTYQGSANSAGEGFQAWRQLSSAGLIAGVYTGTDNNAPYDYGAGFVRHTFGVNSPKSRIANVGWSYSLMDATVGYWPYQFSTDYRNWLAVGGLSFVFPINGFTAEDAWNIDTKMDDGKPGLGSVQGGSSNAECATSNTPATAVYDMRHNDNQYCMLIMKQM